MSSRLESLGMKVTPCDNGGYYVEIGVLKKDPDAQVSDKNLLGAIIGADVPSISNKIQKIYCKDSVAVSNEICNILQLAEAESALDENEKTDLRNV